MNIQWHLVDWNKRDTDLALELSRSRERVRQKRNQVGTPCFLKGFHKDTLDLVRWFLEHEEESKTLHSSVISKLTGMSVFTIKRYKSKLGIPEIYSVKTKKFPVNIINWKLPNTVLSAVWNVHHQLPAQKRYLLKKPPAVWNLQGGRYPDAEEYRQAIEAEKLKARKWWSSNEIPVANLCSDSTK